MRQHLHVSNTDKRTPTINHPLKCRFCKPNINYLDIVQIRAFYGRYPKQKLGGHDTSHLCPPNPRIDTL